MMNLTANHKGRLTLGEDNNALTLLIVINVVVFIILNFIKIVYFLTDIPDQFFVTQILDWFRLSGQTDVVLYRPWTLITSFITHLSVWHLISSLLWLWCFGYILQDLAGNKHIIPIYIYGGLLGSLTFLISVNTIGAIQAQATLTMGAGAAVMAIAVAATALAPNYRIFPLIHGGIPIWVLTLLFVMIDYATIASVNGATALAHLAGAAIGYIYIWQLKNGKDRGLWMNQFAHWLTHLFNPDKALQQTSKKSRLFYNATKEPFVKNPKHTQQRIDELLDKINQHGYHMLTNEEKAFLKAASKQSDE